MSGGLIGYLVVQKWEQYQHYKDRDPPWIKLHNKLLDSYDFSRLHDASKMHLIGIWLLASRSNNRVPADPEWIAKKINSNTPIDLVALLETEFLMLVNKQNQPLPLTEQLASKLKAACNSASGVTVALTRSREAETEVETEVEGKDHVQRFAPDERQAKQASIPGLGVSDEGAPDDPAPHVGGGRPAQVIQVFRHWQTVHGHPQAKLTDERRRRILARLKDGYTVEDLMTAVSGCKLSKHHMGENLTSTIYDDIELICRNGGNVEKFRKLVPRPGAQPDAGPGMHPAVRETVSSLQRAINRLNARADASEEPADA